MRPRLCVARPTLSLSTRSAAAATTETSAERRCGLTPGRLELFAERPDDDVLARREEHLRLLVRERKRRHRVQVDHGLASLQVPGRVVDVRSVEPPAVLGVEAVALGEELLERSRRRVEELAFTAIAPAEGRARARRLVMDVVADPLAAHARAMVGQPIELLRSFDGDDVRRIEREEPDAG